MTSVHVAESVLKKSVALLIGTIMVPLLPFSCFIQAHGEWIDEIDEPCEVSMLRKE